MWYYLDAAFSILMLTSPITLILVIGSVLDRQRDEVRP